MLNNHCCQPVETPRARSPHRVRNLTAMLVLGGGFSLILYNHGAAWWYIPSAVSGVVLAHMAILGGFALIAARLTRTRRAPDGAACHQEGAGRAPASQSIPIRWPRLYDWLVRVITLGGEKKLRRGILDLADLQPGNVVLDVGCGTGTLLLAAAERVAPSGTLHGLDLAGEMVAHARHKAAARRVSLEVIEGSAGSLPYSSMSFDTVFCTMVLHHLPGPLQGDAVREMSRVLRPGGRAVIVDLRRPRSLAGTIAAALSLVSLLHNHGSSTSPSDLLDIEPLMTELGFEGITRHSFGSGAIGAVVGRLGSGKRAADRAEPQDIAHVRPNT